jgi:hypothetical protein
MRRTRFILALVTVALAVTSWARPASAHFCSTPQNINVGEDVMVNIGVAAEEKPVRDVDIEVPDGFALKEPVGFLGYEPTREGKWVHFTGAEIQPFACTFFAFSGQATRKGALVARIVTTAVDGTKTHYDSTKPAALYPAMVIYAGVTLEELNGSKSSVVPRIAVAVGVAIAAVGIAVFIRRRVTIKT